MEIHKFYLDYPVMDLSFLEVLETAFKDDPFELLNRLVRHYTKELAENGLDEKKLKTFRMTLCYEYQLLFRFEKKDAWKAPKDMYFGSMEMNLFLREQWRNLERVVILYNIVILYGTIYCNPLSIEQHFISFIGCVDECFINETSEARAVCVKQMECFLESLQLRQFLYNDIKPELYQRLCPMCLQCINTWMKERDDNEWRSFASLFPKLVKTFGSENVLPPIWNFVLTDPNFRKIKGLRDVLSALTIITDSSFPTDTNDLNPIYNNLCNMPPLWDIVMEGLNCSMQQYRKRALFILKKIKDIMSNRKDLEKIILILEALEEKQYRLIAPALTHIPSLAKGDEKELSCKTNSNSKWLTIILVRMLQHQNNVIVKEGIFWVSKLNEFVQFNLEFMELFVNVLNNTFLYECQPYKEESEILDVILVVFEAMDKDEKNFSAILKIINQIVWAPIPIFYTIKVLRRFSEKTSHKWIDNEQLHIVKSLLRNNLKMHSHILRVASQIELIIIIANFLMEINDIALLANTFFEFISDESLTRESGIWDFLVGRFMSVLPKEQAIDFVKKTCEEYRLQNTCLAIDPKRFAFLIIMLNDAKLILQSETCPANVALKIWLEILSGLDTRPYVDIMAVINAAEFVSHLLKYSTQTIDKNIKKLLLFCLHQVLIFLYRYTRKIAFELDYDEVNRYLNIIVSVINEGDLIMTRNEILDYADKFRNDSICILKNINEYKTTHHLLALNILYYSQAVLTLAPELYHVQPLLDIYNVKIFEDQNVDGKNLKGKLASDYFLILAKLAYQYIKKVPRKMWPEQINWLQLVNYLYEMGGKEIVPVIASILEIIVDNNALEFSSERSNFESFFAACWRNVFLYKKNQLYFLSINNLTRVIINNKFLQLPDARSFISQFVDQLLKEGDEVPKLKKILLAELGKLDTSNLTGFEEPLLSCLLHGHVLPKDKKIEYQAHQHVAKNYMDCFPKSFSLLEYNNDATVRASAFVFLYKQLSTGSNVQYLTKFFSIVLKRLEKYKTSRYFKHSNIHKIKHRIMQVLLIMEPFLDENATDVLQNLMFSSLLLESNQHSVRLMQEWILQRIFLKNNWRADELWNFFEKAIQTRPGCTNSAASIVYQLAMFERGSDLELNFVQKGLEYITRCCLGPQFNVRLYNQVILVKLHEYLKAVNELVSLKYENLYRAVSENLKDINSKNVNRTEDSIDFYISIFCPIKHYSLQTIFFDFPRLTDMDEDELIAPELFDFLKFEVIHDQLLILNNVDNELSQCKTSYYNVKSSMDHGKLMMLKELEMNFDGLSDIQKKINPAMLEKLLHDDIFPTFGLSSNEIKSNEEGLIVVASLIDRIPNLGGLARTCEIFSATELVISNLSYTRDKDFQNLSVTAEKWINITEVKPNRLKEYLLQKKDEGWSLVGVEQTANSTNLLNMKFSKKTVLILGNEKDGIAANLIPLFDVCIEIPQVGLIRSLNVHVTGAICIWQYAKQHILT